VTGGAGQSRLESLTLTDLDSGAAETAEAAALFVLIGAEPRTQWLPDTVRRDQPGFVITGADLLEGNRMGGGRCGACRCSWNPACPGSSRPATSGTGQ
jgi:thioredoxin reductase (NADPH)